MNLYSLSQGTLNESKMCDRHGKPRSFICLEHEEYICEKCAVEDHSLTSCQSIHISNAGRYVISKVEMGMSELKKLKSTSRSILDGKRQDDTVKTIEDAELRLDKFVDEMKKKLLKAKMSLRPFSELTRESRYKLKSIVAKKIPTGQPVRNGGDEEEVRNMVERLGEIREQCRVAKSTLYALPSYVEVEINKDFIHAMKFAGQPILLFKKGEVEEEVDVNDNQTVSSYSQTQETAYLVEKSSFVLEHCFDIVIMDEWIIATVGDSVQKRDRKRLTYRQAITIDNASFLRKIGETSEVAVLQRYVCITVLETNPNMYVLYRIAIDRPYTDICYLESIYGMPPGCPDPSPVFVGCYSKRETYLMECIELIVAKKTKFPGRPPYYTLAARTLAESGRGKQRSRFRGARSVCSFQNRFVVVGAAVGVTCIDKSGNLIWTVDMYNQVVYVMSFRTLVFVIIEGENRITTVGHSGLVITENALPPGKVAPEKFTAHDETMMVKHRNADKWSMYKLLFETME